MMQHPQNGTVSDTVLPPENVSDHVTDSTLPNVHSNRVDSDPVHRSVMYDVQPFLKGGLRSRVIEDKAQEVGGAGTVTDEPDAQHSGHSGTVPANADQGLQAEHAVLGIAPTEKSVIEKNSADVEKDTWEQWRNTMQGKIIDVQSTDHADLFARKLQSHDECLVIVKAARDLIVGEKEQRRKRMDTPAGAGTVADYEKKCAQIDRELDDLEPGGPNPLMQVMCRHAGAKQSFSALKTALKWRALDNVRNLLKIQDDLQRTGTVPSAWWHAVDQLRLASDGLVQIGMLNRDELLAMSGAKSRTSRSKRLMLPRLLNGWQDKFLSINEVSQTYRCAGVLLRHCGLRPVELAMGVKLEINSTGLSVSIKGGKVRATAGQPLRSFTLNLKMLPVWFVDQIRAAGGNVEVVVHENALRAHLYRLSNDVFYSNAKKVPNKANRLKLSAYVFRHALVTELREAGWDEHEIAAVLGETVAETARLYGSRTGRGLSPGITSIVRSSVQTERSVRRVDKTGLKTLMESKHVGGDIIGNSKGAKFAKPPTK